MTDATEGTASAANARPRRSILRAVGRAGTVAGVMAGAAGTLGGLAAGGLLDDADAMPGTPVSAIGVPTDGPWRPSPAHVDISWAVDTSQRLVALTFDDGPMPNWTPMVHDILDEERIPATFFLVGARVRDNARLIHGRMDRHAVGNHTWAHKDLTRMTHPQAYQAMHRAHTMIAKVTGKEPRLLRPPMGNIGGTTVSAAGALGYHVVLWSLKMREAYLGHPPGRLVDYIVDSTEPGTILLAHDTGHRDRLIAIRGLPAMIRGLRAKGFEFVTVPDLLAAAQTGTATT
ncbi:polysaccharide deacetylase family protein [Actinoallomurus acaciae]|uniref:Polysaccharide deacetylase family protein n=1 Tax=Actinoallomurus acaciae TaxID=502577 RepID=A0ABV5YGN4_9ACTN